MLSIFKYEYGMHQFESTYKNKNMYEIFQEIRLTISSGGVIVVIVEDRELLSNILQAFYNYFYNNDSNSEVSYYLFVYFSPLFTTKALPSLNENLPSNMYFMSNYNPNSLSVENINFLSYLNAFTGMKSFLSDTGVVCYSLFKILYEGYEKCETTNFTVIKNSVLGESNVYWTPLGDIIINNDLYVAISAYILRYNSYNKEFDTLTNDAYTFKQMPFSIIKNSARYMCLVNNSDSSKYTKNELKSVNIGFLHPFSGKYENVYSDLPIIFITNTEFLNRQIKDEDNHYFINFRDTTDDLNNIKLAIENLLSLNVIAIFGGYPTKNGRKVIAETIKDKSVEFYYLYDADQEECYFNSNFYVFGSLLHQKLQVIAEYCALKNIQRTVLIYEIDSSEKPLKRSYISRIYDLIMTEHFIPNVQSYILTDISKMKLLTNFLTENMKEMNIIILSINNESNEAVYSEIYNLNQIYKPFDSKINTFTIMDLNLQQSEVNPIVNYIDNNCIITPYTRTFNLHYNDAYTNSIQFPHLKILSLSNSYEFASIALDYYHQKIQSNNVFITDINYYSPEGFIQLNPSNYFSRIMRIGQFDMNIIISNSTNDNNKVEIENIEIVDEETEVIDVELYTINLIFNSSSIIIPEPYYYSNHGLLLSKTCNITEQNNYNNNDTHKIIIVLKERNHNYTSYLLKGYYTALYELNYHIKNYHIIYHEIFIDEFLNQANILCSNEKVIALFGCLTKSCVLSINQILVKYELPLFTYNYESGICNKYVISTVPNSNIYWINLLNYYYVKNYQYFLLISNNEQGIDSSAFKNFCNTLGVHYDIIYRPTINSIKSFFDELTGSQMLIVNTIDNLDINVFNFLSTRGLDETVTFCTFSIFLYINNPEYYIYNTCSIATYFPNFLKEEFDLFEENYPFLYGDKPNYYNYISYFQLMLFNSIIDVYNSTNYMTILNSHTLDKNDYNFANVSVKLNKNYYSLIPVFLVTIDENREYQLLKRYENDIEIFSRTYSRFQPEYFGLICNSDFKIISSLPKYIAVLFNTKEIGLRRDYVLTRPVLMTLLNSINYLSVHDDDKYYYNLAIKSYPCSTTTEIENAMNEILTFNKNNNNQIIAIFGGLSRYEPSVIIPAINGTNIIYFAVRLFGYCEISKNTIVGVNEVQSIVPLINYLVRGGLNEKNNIIVLYSEINDYIVQGIVKRFPVDNLYYIKMSRQTLVNDISKFITEYINTELIHYIVCILEYNSVGSFAEEICSYRKLSNDYILNIYYYLLERGQLHYLNNCQSFINNYIIGTYNSVDYSIYVNNFNSDYNIMNNDVINYLTSNYLSGDIENIHFAEYQFINILFVNILRDTLGITDFDINTYDFYNKEIISPFGLIKLSTNNVLSKMIYVRSFSNDKILITEPILFDFIPCYGYNEIDNKFYYSDYSIDISTNTKKANSYLISIDTIIIGIIIQNKYSDLSNYENGYLISIQRQCYDINTNNGGLAGRIIILKPYYYEDLINNFTTITNVDIYFVLTEYEIVENYFLPLLYLTNKYFFYLLPHAGEVCEKQVIFVNYLPYSFTNYINNYLFDKTKNIVIVYNNKYSKFVQSVTDILLNYHYSDITAISFEMEEFSSISTIQSFIQDYNGTIILLFGNVFTISDEFASSFLSIFKPNEKIIITDLTPLQLSINKRKLLNKFILFGTFFGSILKSNSNQIVSEFKDIANDFLLKYINELGSNFTIDSSIYIGTLSVLILQNIININNDIIISESLNNHLTMISPYGYVTLLPSRLIQQYYMLVKYNYTIKTKNVLDYMFEMIFVEKYSIIPLNYNPYTHSPQLFCSFSLDDEKIDDEDKTTNIYTYNKIEIKLLFIISNSYYKNDIKLYMTFKFKLQTFNENSKEIYYNLYIKQYNNIEELKDILLSNQNAYFCYVSPLPINDLLKVQDTFNNTILLYICRIYSYKYLRYNIIPFSWIDSFVVNVLVNKFEELSIQGYSILAEKESPIYHFYIIIYLYIFFNLYFYC